MQTSFKAITNVAKPGESPKFKVTVEVSIPSSGATMQAELRGEFTEKELMGVLDLNVAQIIRLTGQNN